MFCIDYIVRELIDKIYESVVISFMITSIL